MQACCPVGKPKPLNGAVSRQSHSLRLGLFPIYRHPESRLQKPLNYAQKRSEGGVYSVREPQCENY